MVLSEVLALRSFEERCAARRPGIAMAAITAMIAITIISSISVKPFLFMVDSVLKKRVVSVLGTGMNEQAPCQPHNRCSAQSLAGEHHIIGLSGPVLQA